MSQRAIFIIGVSGSGKSTVARHLAERLTIQFLEGDDYHPTKNREKMSSGHPLTDEDRWPWLLALAQAADAQKMTAGGCVVSCSALKESYRKYITQEMSTEPIWIHLAGAMELIEERMKRRNHFMPVQLLQSQFDTWEPPDYGLQVSIDQEIDRIIDKIVDHLHRL